MSVRPQGLPTLIIHAPSVHSGGGLVLLQALLSVPDLPVHWLQADRRSEQQLQLPADTVIHHVNRSVVSRLGAEWRLWRCTQGNDVVFCFHGLPPLFPLRGRVVVFLQNRILVNRSPINGYLLRTKVRLLLERWMLRTFAAHVDKFITQTPSMAEETKITLGQNLDVVVLPFAAYTPGKSTPLPRQFDFIYIADDAPHKNHVSLLDAWRLLAVGGLKPSLALTVPAESVLSEKIESCQKKYGLHISNLGTISAAEVHRLYRSSSALIFPSTTESLGLPLIEASQHGLPILAPEMDYVRDVVDPIQTFDPYSPISIARAVRRFLGKSEPPLTMRTPEDFLTEVLK